MTISPKSCAHSPDRDALSDVLTAVRFIGGRIETYAAGAHETFAFNEGERSLLIVRSGTLRLACSADQSGPVLLKEGDIALLPYGSDFSVTVLADRTANTDCQWLRGTFHLEERLAARLLSCLPKLAIFQRARYGPMDWLETACRFVMTEVSRPEPGAAVMISRLMELLLIRVLRLWAQQPGAGASWLAGAADPHVSQALSAIHASPERAWSVPELAKIAGLSRSVFAGRFAALVGEPPSRYLIGLRLDKAAERLQRTSSSIAEISSAVGYVSEAAFSRSFKARYGISPSGWRQK